MKKSLFLTLLLCLFITTSCIENREGTPQPIIKNQPIEEVARYKLFPTENIWNFIKLDTQTGRMTMIQFTVDKEKDRFEYELNPNVLIPSGSELINGRFTLYPTQNRWNFILLDQISGQTYQVQWSFEPENRFVIPIKG